MSDEEDEEADANNEGKLLSHLVKDTTEVDLDDIVRDTMLCELVASVRKNKSNSAKKRGRPSKRAKASNKKIWFIMRGMFWNSGGLGDLAKHKHIADCVKDHALDFVAITESGKRDFPTRDLDHFSCGYDYEWHLVFTSDWMFATTTSFKL